MTKLLNEKELLQGVNLIRDGGLVAFRTETVYGLGADATNESAVKKVFAAKTRPTNNPLIVHFHSLKHLLEFFPDISATERDLLKKIPDALTLVLPNPKDSKIAPACLAGQKTVAVRIPSCKFARKFIMACGVPLAAPSANTSTRPSPTRWQDVYDDLNKRIDAIFMGKRTKVGLESTVIQATADKINVLRLGGASVKKIESVAKLPTQIVASSPKSPGTKHRHYTPSVPLHVLTRNEIKEKANDGHNIILCLNKNKNHYRNFHVIALGNSATAVGQNLFPAMREAEKIIADLRSNNTGFEKVAETILVEKMPEGEAFVVINERLSKASS